MTENMMVILCPAAGGFPPDYNFPDILVADLAQEASDLLPHSAHHVQPLLCFMIGRIY